MAAIVLVLAPSPRAEAFKAPKPAAHTSAYAQGVSGAVGAANAVSQALVKGNYDGAATQLDAVMKQLQTARGKANAEEQRKLLVLEDRGLQLAGLIAIHSPRSLSNSQEFLDAVSKSQVAAGSVPAPAPRKPAAKPAAKPGGKPAAKPKGAWPVKPDASRRGKPNDSALARLRLAKAVVGAIHAEQALLRGQMGQALGQVRGLRGALKQARAKGTPWQRQALGRLDKQANQLQLELSHRNPAAFGHASRLVDASLQVQQSFKLADAGGGGGQKPQAQPGAKKPGKKPTKKPGGKKPGAKKPGAKKPTKKPGKPLAPKPPTLPKPRLRETPPPMPDMPLPPSDPTMDEEHPGSLPRP